MNHSQDDYRYDLSPIENIDIVFGHADTIKACFPEYYVVIDTLYPVNQQALCPVDYDAACEAACMGNCADDSASRYIVVSLRELGER